MSSVASRAVRNSTGVRMPSVRSRRHTSNPSRSGSITSSTMRSGCTTADGVERVAARRPPGARRSRGGAAPPRASSAGCPRRRRAGVVHRARSQDRTRSCELGETAAEKPISEAEPVSPAPARGTARPRSTRTRSCAQSSTGRATSDAADRNGSRSSTDQVSRADDAVAVAADLQPGRSLEVAADEGVDRLAGHDLFDAHLELEGVRATAPAPRTARRSRAERLAGRSSNDRSHGHHCGNCSVSFSASHNDVARDGEVEGPVVDERGAHHGLAAASASRAPRAVRCRAREP